MRKKIAIICLFVMLVQTGFSQTLDKVKLDNYFMELEKSNKFMGSVAISQNGEIIYTKSIGYADVKTKSKANDNTKYRVGSVSKSFTSVLVMKAVEDSKLTLETKLKQFFPTIKNADKITVSNLLNHRSGIHNFTSDSTYLTWSMKKKSEMEMIKVIEAGGSDFEPDTKAVYSNSNYVLLSYILQKIYKKTYAEILTEKIIKPVGLKNTSFGGKINLKNNECNSYGYVTNWEIEAETDTSIPMGAGAIISTPSDLTKFAAALFEGKIISLKSVELMKVLKDNYGFGLIQMPFEDKKGYGHNGSIDGFRSIYSYFPTEKLAVAITSNANNYKMNKIALVLCGAAFNKPYEIPNFNGFVLKTEDLDKYLGVYGIKDMPFKITITKNGKVLVAQATGQSSFELEATEKDKFQFDRAKLTLEFKPNDKILILNQGGQATTFIRE